MRPPGAAWSQQVALKPTVLAMATIRLQLLRLTQIEMACVAGVNQSTVSRWERGQLEPSRSEMDAIRQLAAERGIEWDDRWFFEGPPADLPEGAAA